MRITRLLIFALLLDSSPCLATGSYQFADHLMKSITSDEGQVSEKTVLEPTLYSYFSRLLRKSCQDVPGIGSIAGQDPPTFKRYTVRVVSDNDKTANVKVFSKAQTESGTETLDLTLRLRKIDGNWKIFDACSAGQEPHYCYRSEVMHWKCG